MILHNMNISGRVLPTTAAAAMEGVIPALTQMLLAQGAPLVSVSWLYPEREWLIVDLDGTSVQTRPEVLYRVLLGSNLKHEAATLETTPTELLLDRLSGRR